MSWKQVQYKGVGVSQNRKSHTLYTRSTVLSKVDDFPTFKKLELHAENSTLYKVEVVWKFSTF